MGLDELVFEATECDFKSAVEVKKPKSWLKSVSAFANGIGGSLWFGVGNDRRVVGLADAQSDAEAVSRLIKERISPLPPFSIVPHSDDGRDVIELVVASGRSTPYYYKGDGTAAAFIRAGNETLQAPDHILNELVLKGTNRTFDALASDVSRSAYSFTLLEATYSERARREFMPSDYQSFGLADSNGFLTNAGCLLVDQAIILNSRLFCTRWNGLAKSSILDDAVDSREESGGLIALLRAGRDFVRANSKTRFKKEADCRVDKPDYSGRAITEALVNALIHRDYLVSGAEVHIDIYDDRREIVSPGGMFFGPPVQNRAIETIGSVRRNPVIADMFARMRFMERRGSGLKKIVDETASLPGFTDAMRPQFISTDCDFRVILKNLNHAARDAARERSKDASPLFSFRGRRERGMKTIAVINQKGGVGKTTTAAALAGGLARRGKRTLAIDLAPQCNLTSTYRASSDRATAADLLEGNALRAVQHTECGDIIAGHRALTQAESSLIGPDNSSLPFILRNALVSFCDDYDFVIIDTPPALGVLTAAALAAADAALITAQADYYSMDGIARLDETIEAIRAGTNPGLEILGILLTRYDPRAILSRTAAEQIAAAARNMGTRLFKTTIRESITHKEAQMTRRSIFDYAPKSNAASDYMALTDEILEDGKI